MEDRDRPPAALIPIGCAAIVVGIAILLVDLLTQKETPAMKKKWIHNALHALTIIAGLGSLVQPVAAFIPPHVLAVVAAASGVANVILGQMKQQPAVDAEP